MTEEKLQINPEYIVKPTKKSIEKLIEEIKNNQMIPLSQSKDEAIKFFEEELKKITDK